MYKIVDNTIKVKKVSIIIPIYGVELFIERCAISLFEQTLDDIEYIFVDDCTMDKSVQILQGIIAKYPQRKDNVFIIRHERNKGLASARKTGLKFVHGEYVAHCDSDDWVERNMYEYLYQEAISANADIVWCDYYRSDGESKKTISTKVQPELMQGPVWNKLVRTRLYTDYDIEFPTANKGEDGALMVQLSFFANKRIHVAKPLYNYFINPTSICGVITPEACLNRLSQEKTNVKFKTNFLIRQGVYEKYKDSVLRWKILSRKNLLPILEEQKYYQIWKGTFPEADKEYLKSPKINFRMKIGYILIRLRLDRVFKSLVQKWA